MLNNKKWNLNFIKNKETFLEHIQNLKKICLIINVNNIDIIHKF